MKLDRTAVRMLGGIGFVLGVAGVLVCLCLLILPSEADIRRAEQALSREGQPRKPRKDARNAYTDVTRWDFSTRLPVPGGGDRYRWRASGEFARSLGPDRDRMVNFRLETSNVEDQIVLVSPMAVYDRKAQRLDSNAGAYVTFPWGSVRSNALRLELEHVDAYFDGDVVVDAVERGGLNTVGAQGGGEEGGTTNGAAGGNDGSDNAKTGDEVEAKKPLRITSDHFEIHSAENKGVFTGSVVARDESGTIWADEMVVEYYTKEEKAADPTLTGMKRITCVGHVRIDQKTEQAMCERAVFDVPKNVITMEKSETGQVMYRKDKGDEKYEILADKVTIDRNPGGTTKFEGNTETTDFSETTEGFFGLSGPDDAGGDKGATTDGGATSNDDGAGTTDTQ